MLRYIYGPLILSILILSWCGSDISTDSAVEEISTVSPIEEEVIISSEELTDNSSELSSSRALWNPKTPSFSEVSIDWEHSYDSGNALSFLWGTFFDLEGDGKNEFIITGGAAQNDAVFRYTNGTLQDISSQTGINNFAASYAAYSIDFDKSGSDDLFIARQDGIYFYENTAGKLNETKLAISFPQNAVPLDIDFADIDSDWDLDMYVSTFITPSLFRAAVFNDPSHVQTNLMLRNDGDLNFVDITSESWVNVIANTFSSSFADLDSDGDLDLVVSPNTDSVKIFENDAGIFSLAYEWEIYGFWMGLGIADYDNDGDEDIFFSSIGTSIPERLVQWDSNASQDVKARYLFLENTGDMSFKEKKEESFDDLGFGWWIVPTDINLDARSDYLIMQNYIKWAPHKLSKLPGELLENTSSSFTPKIWDYDIENKNYGISALLWDINGDNFDDIIYLNLDNNPKIYLRNADRENNFLKVIIPNTPKYLHVTMTLKAWEDILAEKQYLPKQGLLTKQDNSLIFGLNRETLIPTELVIQFHDGSEESILLENNTLIDLR